MEDTNIPCFEDAIKSAEDTILALKFLARHMESPCGSSREMREGTRANYVRFSGYISKGISPNAGRILRDYVTSLGPVV